MKPTQRWKLLAITTSLLATFSLGVLGARAFDGSDLHNTLPLVIPYQGHLQRDMQPAQGMESMTFRLYDVSTAGSPLWASSMRTVPLSDGKFSIVLGDANDATKLNPELFSQGALYLGVTVDGVELSPRQRLAPVPQAIAAARAAGDFTIPGDAKLSGDLQLLDQDPNSLDAQLQQDSTTLHIRGHAPTMADPRNIQLHDDVQIPGTLDAFDAQLDHLQLTTPPTEITATWSGTSTPSTNITAFDTDWSSCPTGTVVQAIRLTESTTQAGGLQLQLRCSTPAP